MNSGVGLNINLGIALSHSERHGIRPAHLACHFFRKPVPDKQKDGNRNNVGKQQAHPYRHLLFDILGEFRSRIMKTLHQSRIIHHTGLVDMFLILVRKNDFCILNLHKSNLFIFCHRHKCTVIDFFRPLLQYVREQQPVQQKDDYRNHERIYDKRFSR